jgi:hypothetical protein
MIRAQRFFGDGKRPFEEGPASAYWFCIWWVIASL